MARTHTHLTIREGDFIRFPTGGNIQIKKIEADKITIRGDFEIPDCIEEKHSELSTLQRFDSDWLVEMSLEGFRELEIINYSSAVHLNQA